MGKGQCLVQGKARAKARPHRASLLTMPVRGVMGAKTREVWGQTVTRSGEQTLPCVQ